MQNFRVRYICLFILMGALVSKVVSSKITEVSKNAVYTAFGNVTLNIDLKDKYVSIGDTFNDIRTCANKKFSKCIAFDATIIAVPSLQIMQNMIANKSEGKSKSYTLESAGVKVKLSVKKVMILGVLFEGIILKASLKNGDSTARGEYFYVPEHGIVSFVHFFRTYSMEKEKYIEQKKRYINSDMKGIFAEILN